MKQNIIFGGLTFLAVIALFSYFTLRAKVKSSVRSAKIEKIEKNEGGGVEIPTITLAPIEYVAPEYDDIPLIEEPKPLKVYKELPPKSKEVKIVNYEPVLDSRQKARWKERMSWRKSIVDLLKLIYKPSDGGSRDEMADDFGYTGPDGSYERNIWLHRRVRKGLKNGEIPLN